MNTENNQQILKTTIPPFPKSYETIRLNSDSTLTINQYYNKIYLCQSICMFMVKSLTFKKNIEYQKYSTNTENNFSWVTKNTLNYGGLHDNGFIYKRMYCLHSNVYLC